MIQADLRRGSSVFMPCFRRLRDVFQASSCRVSGVFVPCSSVFMPCFKHLRAVFQASLCLIGLCQVSYGFSGGGQETIARLITYDGIKQKLWGIQLSSAVEPGSPITVEGKKVGKLTSYTGGNKG
nr:putative transferase At1g60990, chloroplastic [Tanacetum cinerariifolium]